MFEHPRLEYYIAAMVEPIRNAQKLKVVKLMKESRIDFGYDGDYSGLKACKDVIDDFIWGTGYEHHEVEDRESLQNDIIKRATMIINQDHIDSPWYKDNIRKKDSLQLLDETGYEIARLSHVSGWDIDDIMDIVRARAEEQWDKNFLECCSSDDESCCHE